VSSISPARPRLAGAGALALGATLISFAPVFVKLAPVGPTTAAFYRMLFGGLILAGIVAVRRERIWLGRRHLLLALACGAVFALDLSVWHRSIHYVGPGLATILGNFQVFFLAAWGVAVLRERPGWKLAAAIPLALGGLVLIVGPAWRHLGGHYHLGVMLGLFTAVCYATYLLVLRQLQADASLAPGGQPSPMVDLAIISLLSAGVLGLEIPVLGESFRIPDWKTGLLLVMYGVVGQVLAWVIISRALARVEASRAGLILLLQPALAFVWDVVFFARPTRPLEVAGALIALTAIYLGTLSRRR
jgi:drug/metabolite transporter (DMT)-like permease